MKIKIPKHLEDTHRLKDWPGQSLRQFFGARFRLVDLNTLTPEKADLLIKKGFPYLEKIQKTVSSKKQEGTEKE